MPSTVRLVVAYEGTRYHGWQVQPNGLTVQQVLEDAFHEMTGLRTRLTAAGRTDAGVHAEGQVACLTNESRHDADALRKGLNALLPDDIVVIAAHEVPADFDPRRHAVGKHYRYAIHNADARPVFARHFRWHLRQSLDVGLMRAAAGCLRGEHDFSAFRASGCEAAGPIRRVDAAEWVHDPPTIRLEILGNGFLKQMVRNIVGTCVEAGRGKLPAGDLPAILASRDREKAGPTAPACGLVLKQVYYDQEEYRHAVEGVVRAGAAGQLGSVDGVR